MNLFGLLSILDKSTEFAKLLARLDARGEKPRLALQDAAKPFVLAALQRRVAAPILVVTARAERAKAMFDQLHAWVENPDIVKLFPEPDALPYERVGWDMSTIRERLEVLAQLQQAGSAQPAIVVACAQAIMQKTLSSKDFAAFSHTIHRGQRIDLNQFLSMWVRMGYEAGATVEVPGTFARRGGIVDIFPPAAELPARIDLFGDEVDNIRLFDPASQRSLRIVDSVTITPPREVLGILLAEGSDSDSSRAGRDETSSFLDLSLLQPELRELFERELAALANGEALNEAEFYAGLVAGATIFDYLSPGALVIVDEPAEVQQTVEDLTEQASKLRDAQVERGDLPAGFPSPCYGWSDLEKAMAAVERHLDLAFCFDEGPEAEEDEIALPFGAASPYASRLRVLVDDIGKLMKERRRVVVTSQQSRRLAEILNERDIIVEPIERLAQLPPPGALTLVHGTLAEGWHLDLGQGRQDDAVQSLTVLTDGEIFGVSKPRRFVRKRSVNRQAFLTDLSVGDYVVHIEHGIGRFAGSKKMDVEGLEREFLVLDYAQGDKLYVPVDQIDRLNRYVGAGEHVPALTRLGTQEWAHVKERVKKSVQHIAKDLLAIYSTREIVQGFAFSHDNVWQQEMEASFPYVETTDQLEAIYEVKEDMEQPKPMDRLICGDVGYGKTEVALRAAFKAVMDGKQVAVLVPTTVLAQQHFETFKERMSAFPVNIEVLSRFRSDKEQRSVVDGLKEGKVDICIGTHRLLQKDITFKDLGLLIIDEEQRFGVVHKELLKRMRAEVDVLTLTATPIPRTLHMAVAGVRDMSTIETPPEERLPIKTYVTGYDDGLVRQAILKEMDRGGQVFFVHNRVENIAHIANHLMNLVPEAAIGVGHGQMREEQLEKVMLGFAAGKIDVLVCTTIIESGLDMPNVNTLIVNQADRFGLAQLYQLRGRVGRGANRAYAYFLYNKSKRLTETAEKRLKTIFQATELGAGFRIAMKDLEIRGAGNLLGSEQSGHMSAVGFDLYCRLLAQAVAEQRAKRDSEAGRPVKPVQPEIPSWPPVDLPVDAHIAEEYVADYATRLSLYQRLAQISDIEDIEEMTQELWDRFGDTPEPVRNLLYVLTVKLLAAKAGAMSVIEEAGQIVVKFDATIGADRAKLQQIGGSALKIGNMQLRLDWRRAGRKWKDILQTVLEFMAGVGAAQSPHEAPKALHGQGDLASSVR